MLMDNAETTVLWNAYSREFREDRWLPVWDFFTKSPVIRAILVRVAGETGIVVSNIFLTIRPLCCSTRLELLSR